MEDDGRTLASYGIQGSEEYDDIVTLEMVVVAPLTPEQIEARLKEVWDAAEAGGGRKRRGGVICSSSRNLARSSAAFSAALLLSTLNTQRLDV